MIKPIKTSYIVPKDTLVAIKKYAIDNNTTIGDIIRKHFDSLLNSNN